VLAVAAVYLVLVGFQVAGAVVSRKKNLDDRAFFAIAQAGILCHTAATGLTGGMTSPLWPALLGNVVSAYIFFGRGWMGDVGFGVMAASAALYTFMPPSVVGPPIAAPYGAILTAWSIVYTVGVLRASTLSLSDAYRQAGDRRDRLREDVLQAAAARAQTLESISSKVAHELKNPLSSIKALGQLLARGSTEEKMRERIQVITAEATRMEGILHDYLSFSRPFEDLRAEPVALGALADDVLAVLEGRADDAGVALLRSGEDVNVVADPRRLKEALLNLAANALEATPRGGSVEIAVFAQEDGAEVTVSDTGKGIARDALAKVGTPFFTTRDGGTGLGVVLARTVILQHGGEMVYDSELGRGTTVTVRLPAEPPKTKKPVVRA
jgi:signal transduction histidine kinase